MNLIIRLLDHLVKITAHEKASGMDIDVESDNFSSKKANLVAHIEEIDETIYSLALAIQMVHNDNTQRSSEAIQLRELIEDIDQNLSSLRKTFQDQNDFVSAVGLNLEVTDVAVQSLKLMVNDMQCASYDGTFTWKITNIYQQMKDAQVQRQTSIYSPPFYSSPTGYKMRAQLYLDGNGDARRTHMSLFFVLMRGPNDAILKFPFNYKVTFCLYDQTSQQQHITGSFRPDINSSSFQRPRSEMNIASGIPKFFPLAMIRQADNPYVRDDTMFIKVMVDFGDIPNTLLPYELSLNPGLPTHVQQILIKQEGERRAQQQPQQTPTTFSTDNEVLTTPTPSSTEMNNEDRVQDSGMNISNQELL